MPPYQTEEPQPHLWDGTPMAAMPYVISKGNDTPDQREHRVYEGMNMSKAEELADKLLTMQQSGLWYTSQDAAAELRRLSAINAELIAKTTLVLRSFPTDSDMLELGWTQAEVDEACNAYDDARAAIAKAQGGE
ncbi:hypothetical protein KBW71_03525 [Hydrogenophaga aromaticivorans]|uniref:hypothetical protein n=1 Tax=Hydrogenophaga aromaticivorans TaxID=2610898 RepID=UPI001B392E20|nr:hypothetical protein [Hydrogenophaga aromaticivorans]MBQ0917500.1 hypothetical protein [Hydrogenophaga aromaticivorans]